MKGRKYNEIDGFGKTLNRFKGKKHKNIVRKVLQQNSQVKKNNYISAYDPATKQFLSGTLKEVASGLGVSTGTLSKRLKVGDKMEMTDVKGFIIGKHKDVDNLVKYKTNINKEDSIIEKTKAITSAEADAYLDLLAPNYNIVAGGVHMNNHFGINENRFNLEIGNELTIDDISSVIGDTISAVKNTDSLTSGDKVRFVIMDETLNHPISTPLMDIGDITEETIMNLVERTIESNEEFSLSEDTEIIITSIKGDDISKKKEADKKSNYKKGKVKMYQGYTETKKKKIKNPLYMRGKKKYKGLNDEIGALNPIAEQVINEETDLVEYTESGKKHKLNTQFKKSVIQIKNKDSLCVPRAIATGFYMATEGVNSKNYDNAKRGRKIQETKALELVASYEEVCGEKYNGEGFSVEDLETFEFITGLSITAIDGDNSLNIVYPNIEKGKKYIPPEDNTQTIYLYLHTENGLPHCSLINNGRVAGFFGRHYFCHKCKKCYEKKDLHKCKFSCKMCCKANCPTISADKGKMKYHIECGDCCRFFPNETCFKNHKLSGAEWDTLNAVFKNGKTPKVKSKTLSVCDRIWKCQECKKVMKKDIQPKATHICGDYLCNNCKQIVHKDHKCYMLPRKLNKPRDEYVYFDFECDIEEKEGKKEHEVMFAVSMYQNSSKPIIHETLNEWCEWAFADNNKDHTFIAHNGMGYDYRFIIRWVYENTDYKPFVIWGGQKIITLSIKELGIRFIDSLSFLTMPLKAFPKTFGQKELKKGYFPHWFNTVENRNYIGAMYGTKRKKCANIV